MRIYCNNSANNSENYTFIEMFHFVVILIIKYNAATINLSICLAI